MWLRRTSFANTPAQATARGGAGCGLMPVGGRLVAGGRLCRRLRSALAALCGRRLLLLKFRFLGAAAGEPDDSPRPTLVERNAGPLLRQRRCREDGGYRPVTQLPQMRL